MLFLQQSSATFISFGPFLDKTDGNTLETGLVGALDHATTGIMISKDGGALAVRTAGFTASTYDAYGCYRVHLSTTDTNTLGKLRVIFTDNNTTALPVWMDFMVTLAIPYNSFFNNNAFLAVDVTNWRGSPVVVNVTNGLPDVNVLRISDDNVAANNAEAFFDGTGYAGTGNTIPNVTTVAAVTTVNGLAANSITAASMAADAGTEIAAAVWNEDATGHQTQGSFGQAIGDPVADTNTLYKAVVTDATGATVGVDVAARLDVAVSTRLAPTTAGRTLDINAGGVAGVDWANVEGQSTSVNLSNTSIFDVTQVSTNTDTIISALPTSLTTGGLMKASVEAINDVVESADDLQLSAATIVRGTASGVPTTTTMPASDLPSSVNDHYNGRIIIFTSGVLADQATSISDYVGGTKTLTFVAITSAPAAGVTFVII